MILKTLDMRGPQHGRGLARRIEQISGDLLAVNQGTLSPATPVRAATRLDAPAAIRHE
jgi:hypothetical protein